MSKTQIAIDIIDRSMALGREHRIAAELAAHATGLKIFSEGPAGSMGEGRGYVESLPRHARRSLFKIFDRNWRRKLADHYAGPALPSAELS